MEQNLFSTNNIVTSDRVLYTPSAFAKNSLLYLQEIGTLVANRKHTSKRANLDSYLFFVVESGAGELSYGSGESRLRQGDCVFLDCRKPYAHTTDPDNLWKLSWIHFNGGQVPAIYEKYVSRGGKAVFHPAGPDNFLSLHKNLFTMASSNDYIRDMKINALLSELLVYLMAESWNPEEKDNKKGSLSSLKSYLDEHYDEKLYLDELAEKFYINKYYLTRIFKEQYGVSINTYIQRAKITRAKQLLRFTDDTLESIGERCGIGEPNYFSRMFKRVEGITPSEYRKQWKNSRHGAE